MFWYFENKSWIYHSEDASIIGPRKPREIPTIERQKLYREARAASVLEPGPEGMMRPRGMPEETPRWVLDYTGMYPLSAYSRNALVALVNWGARLAADEGLDAYAEVDLSRDADIMRDAEFQAFESKALMVPGEGEARQFTIMKFKR